MNRPLSVRRCLAYGVGGVGALAVVVVGYLWFVLLSPFGYTRPSELAPIDTARIHRVFAYGTLRYAPVRWVVIGRTAAPRPAALPGFRAEGLNVVSDKGAHVEGVVFEVTAAELSALDRYERLGVRYERVEFPLDDGKTAWVYRRMPRETGRQASNGSMGKHVVAQERPLIRSRWKAQKCAVALWSSRMRTSSVDVGDQW